MLPPMAPTNHRRPIPSPGASRPISALLLLLPLLLLTPRCSVAQSPTSSSGNNNDTDTDDNSYFEMTNYNASMAILIVVLVCAFFILGFLSMYLRRCGGDVTESVRVPARRGGEWRSWRHRGLDPAVLETFPTLAYSEVKELKIGKGSLECAVCLSEFEDDETLRLLPKCRHVFHPDCIDAWLASHVTCPVCRSNLVPDPDAPRTTAADLRPPAPAAVEGTEGDGERMDAEPAAEGAPAAPAVEQVVITVEEEAAEMETGEEAAELERIRNRTRAMRSRSGRRPARFPRSHSTGHSMAQPGENLDRYTLRLPEHILLKIVAARKLHRSTSCLALPAGEGSSRRGYRGGGGDGGEGSSRGGRWIRPGLWPSSFFVRTFSAKIPTWRRGDGEGSVNKGDGEGSTRGKRSAVAPFDCLGGGGKAECVADEGESSSAAMARRV